MPELAPELHEAILLAVAGDPRLRDYHPKRDIARMKTLKAACRVCRLWRTIAQPLLPEVIVFTSVRRAGIWSR